MVHLTRHPASTLYCRVGGCSGTFHGAGDAARRPGKKNLQSRLLCLESGHFYVTGPMPIERLGEVDMSLCSMTPTSALYPPQIRQLVLKTRDFEVPLGSGPPSLTVRYPAPGHMPSGGLSLVTRSLKASASSREYYISGWEATVLRVKSKPGSQGFITRHHSCPHGLSFCLLRGLRCFLKTNKKQNQHPPPFFLSFLRQSLVQLRLT